MSMVLRHGATQKQRLGRSRSLAESRTVSEPSNPGIDGEVPELDQVDAMVEGVKARGGRDLLQYVRGLLS